MIDPQDIDPETNRPYSNYSSPSLDDGGFHENEMDIDDEDVKDALVDALTNFMHGAKEAGIDFDAALETARMHFEAEGREDGRFGEVDDYNSAESRAEREHDAQNDERVEMEGGAFLGAHALVDDAGGNEAMIHDGTEDLADMRQMTERERLIRAAEDLGDDDIPPFLRRTR